MLIEKKNCSVFDQVTSPILKLFAELVQNRSQRLQFDSTSPNGVLLFREASKVLCSYGTCLFTMASTILLLNYTKNLIS